MDETALTSTAAESVENKETVGSLRKNLPRWTWLGIGLLILLFVIGGGYLYWQRNLTETEDLAAATAEMAESPKTALVEKFQPVVTPTPFLFQELTVPHLRTRSYESQLGELKKSSETGTYESFLTSYTSDGLRVDAQLTKPKGEMPVGGWPAVVFVHGYIPPSQYTTLGKYVAYVDTLARNKLVVLKIDLRGHGNSEGEAGGGYYSADYVIDTLNARAALQKTDFVNPQHIGLWGHSMAGNVVMRAWAARPEIAAVVVWAGAGYSYEDLQAYRIQDGSYQTPPANSERQRKRQLLRETHGDFDKGSWFWKQVPATNYLSDLQGALQIHHAVDDAVVSVEYSRNLMRLMDATSIPHELFEYSSGGHNITNPSFQLAMQRTVQFYMQRLSFEPEVNS